MNDDLNEARQIIMNLVGLVDMLRAGFTDTQQPAPASTRFIMQQANEWLERTEETPKGVP